jgi:hypothetical protein
VSRLRNGEKTISLAVPKEMENKNKKSKIINFALALSTAASMITDLSLLRTGNLTTQFVLTAGSSHVCGPTINRQWLFLTHVRTMEKTSQTKDDMDSTVRWLSS